MSRAYRGFSLVEILIALALGLSLLAAFLTVLMHCRALFAAQESVARLDDSARQALAVLVPDIEAAGGYGFTTDPSAILERDGVVLARDFELRQPDVAAVAAAAGLPPGAHACGVNFAVDLSRPAQGSNNSFAAGSGATDCAPTGAAGGAHAGSDTLTVRHAAAATATPHTGRMQVYSARFGALVPLTLLADGRAPGPIDSDHELRDLEVRTYYVANSSVDRPGWPALRVKALTESGGQAQFRDEEILPGVEDLQVEFGVAQDPGASPRIRYVAPDTDEARTGRVVAVRLWLRLRADSTERNYVDSRPLRYADVNFLPDAIEAAQRRVLVERTIALRNEVAP